MNTNTKPGRLERICFTVCIVTISLTTLLAFVLIWGGANNEFVWKSLASLMVLFGGSAATLSVSRAVGRREPAQPGQLRP